MYLLFMYIKKRCLMEVRKENYTIKTDGLIIKKNKGTEESLLSKSNQ